MKNRLIKIVSLFLLLTVLAPAAQSQCPMCRMTAESNLKEGGKVGKGLNAGILFMLSMPYLLVGTIGYLWYRNRKKEERPELN